MHGIRADNLAYLRKTSKEALNALFWFDPWHRWGSYGHWVRSKPKYKKHNRKTIRRPEA